MVEIRLPKNEFVHKDQIWSNVIEFLNQDQLFNLSQCNKSLNQLSEEKLYSRVHVVAEPPLRSDQWFIDTNTTYIFGYRKMIKHADQNDIFLYDKLERLLESTKLNKIKHLYISEKNFNETETGHNILSKLVQELINLGKIQAIQVQDDFLFNSLYDEMMKFSNQQEFLRLRTLDDIKFVGPICKTLQLDSNHCETSIKPKIFFNIQTLILTPNKSLNILSEFAKNGIKFPNLKTLRLNHVHNNEESELSAAALMQVVPIVKLTSLELGFCCEIDECLCAKTFFATLGPLLLNLSNLSLIEKSIETSTHHTSKEKWDIDINHFIIELPQFGAVLKKLCIMHTIPADGQVADSVDGNYFRRRKMFEQMLPHLVNLKTLIAPTFIQSLSCFEVLACDFLWNGCRCPYCEKILAILDKYMHNHVFFNSWYSNFKDLSPTNLVAYGSTTLSNRLLNKEYNPLNTFHDAPLDVYWDFHGYDNITHYDGYECYFDESAFKHLAACFQHFTDTYMEYLVHFLPNMKSCCLSGIYYFIEDHSFHSVYDHVI